MTGAGESLIDALRQASPGQLDELVGQMMPYTAHLGVEFLAAGPEAVHARLPWAAHLCTAGSALHGGALMGLADVCGGVCAFLNLPDGAAGTTTIESKTNFFRAVRQGHAEARTEPLHVGRTTIVVQTDLFDADGRRAARVTQTQAVLT